mgnify:CR=1 FL=1
MRGSAQKARLVIDMIRGKDVNQALAILRYANKRAAAGIEKCVRSAIANANEAAEKANVSIDPDDLWVKAAYVDRGPTKNRRRVTPGASGAGLSRAAPLLSRDDPALQRRTRGRKAAKGSVEVRRAQACKLAESKTRKRGGAVAAPRAQRARAGRAKPEAAAET